MEKETGLIGMGLIGMRLTAMRLWEEGRLNEVGGVEEEGKGIKFKNRYILLIHANLTGKKYSKSVYVIALK